MDKSNPKNKLSKKEENQIFEVLFEERFADKTPHKIVPLLLDQGIYICSPSTMYRRMKEEKLTRKRNTNQKESKPRCKPNVIAYRPNEVAVWDITYLPTLVKGMYFKLLVVMDLYSRKILGTRVFEQDTLEQSKEFLKELVKELDLKRELKVLHGDNGSTLKGKTLSVLLTELGVLESHSRPRVSNDNPHIESYFGTVKTHYNYPKYGFKSVNSAQEWVNEFVETYNNEPHKSLDHVTPNQRHKLEDREIKMKRKKVLEEFQKKHPERFPNGIRSYTMERSVCLIPMDHKDIQEILQENDEFRSYYQIPANEPLELVEIL